MGPREGLELHDLDMGDSADGDYGVKMNQPFLKGLASRSRRVLAIFWPAWNTELLRNPYLLSYLEQRGL